MSERPRNVQITDDGSLHKYRTEIPNTVVRGIMGRGLSLPARWLYVYLKSIAGDKGTCWQNTETMAKGAQLSKGAVHQAKKELIHAKLIVIKPGNKGRHQTDTIRILDIWDQNFHEFLSLASSPDELVEEKEISTESADTESRVHHMNSEPATSSPHEHASSPHEHASSPHELKKISLKKIPKKNLELSSNEESIPPSGPEDSCTPKYSTAFERFWHEYPVKKEKREAWKKWRAQKLDAKADMVIQSVIAHRSRDPSWKEGFIPYAQKYLGRQRWEDELPDQEHAMTWEAQSQAAIAKAYAEGTPYDAR